jgi:hypothetical protein
VEVLADHLSQLADIVLQVALEAAGRRSLRATARSRASP